MISPKWVVLRIKRDVNLSLVLKQPVNWREGVAVEQMPIRQPMDRDWLIEWVRWLLGLVVGLLSSFREVGV